MEPGADSVAAAAHDPHKTGPGVLTLIVILIAIGVAIKAITSTLKVMLATAMELLRWLATTSFLFLVVLVMLIGQLGGNFAGEERQADGSPSSLVAPFGE